MGRFRTFSRHCTMDSSEYNSKLDSLELYKFARTKDRNKKTINFHVNYRTFEVTSFHDYNTFLKFAKAFFILDPDCNFCCDTPFNLEDGIMAQIHYTELIDYVHNCKVHSCNCNCYDIIQDVDVCKELKGHMFPYGHFNNPKLGRNFKFPAKINICRCEDGLCCPEYVFCKCPPCGDCKCCDYQVMFPTQYKFIFYNKNSNPNCPQPGAECMQDEDKYINAFSVMPKHKEEEFVKKQKPPYPHPAKEKHRPPPIKTALKSPKSIRPQNPSIKEESGEKKPSYDSILDSFKPTYMQKAWPKKTPANYKKPTTPKKTPVTPKKPFFNKNKVGMPDSEDGPVIWKNGKPVPMCCPHAGKDRKSCGSSCSGPVYEGPAPRPRPHMGGMMPMMHPPHMYTPLPPSPYPHPRPPTPCGRVPPPLPAPYPPSPYPHPRPPCPHPSTPCGSRPPKHP